MRSSSRRLYARVIGVHDDDNDTARLDSKSAKPISKNERLWRRIRGIAILATVLPAVLTEFTLASSNISMTTGGRRKLVIFLNVCSVLTSDQASMLNHFEISSYQRSFSPRTISAQARPRPGTFHESAQYSIKLRDDFLKIYNCENVNSMQDKIHNIEPKKALDRVRAWAFTRLPRGSAASLVFGKPRTDAKITRERERVCGRYACVCVSQRVSLHCNVAKTPTEKFLRAQTPTVQKHNQYVISIRSNESNNAHPESSKLWRKLRLINSRNEYFKFYKNGSFNELQRYDVSILVSRLNLLLLWKQIRLSRVKIGDIRADENLKNSRHPVAFWQVARSFSAATTYRSPQPTQRFISFCLFFRLCDTPSYEFLSLLIYLWWKGQTSVTCNHFKLKLLNGTSARNACARGVHAEFAKHTAPAYIRAHVILNYKNKYILTEISLITKFVHKLGKTATPITSIGSRWMGCLYLTYVHCASIRMSDNAPRRGATTTSTTLNDTRAAPPMPMHTVAMPSKVTDEQINSLHLEMANQVPPALKNWEAFTQALMAHRPSLSEYKGYLTKCDEYCTALQVPGEQELSVLEKELRGSAEKWWQCYKFMGLTYARFLELLKAQYDVQPLKSSQAAKLCGATQGEKGTRHRTLAGRAVSWASRPASPAAESAPVDLSHLRTAAKREKKKAVKSLRA
ncbi:unnamed protein product [Trichogramma brassicae]|uniref:Retrotransposon gag domain-containing protein n=1 Tax=Trichogramma brassicae TaxID=86971 RepID=A0A6H5IFH0_9HYME|nr:unnamed protein product [Trichogramma brassicae]